MATEKAYVDIDFVKAVGSMPSHDIDAVDALYPGFVKQTIESVSRKFDDRAVPQGKVDDVKKHLAALIVAELWNKRGANVNPDTDAKVHAMKLDALEWLANAKTVDEVRKSAAPPPSPLSADDAKIPQHDPFPNVSEKARGR